VNLTCKCGCGQFHFTALVADDWFATGCLTCDDCEATYSPALYRVGQWDRGGWAADALQFGAYVSLWEQKEEAK
jgi:hypothetical protein